MARVKDCLLEIQYEQEQENGLRKSSYLRLEDLQCLQKNLQTIDKELYEVVTDWIEFENRGEYLLNIFTGGQLVKLLVLQKDWKLL